MSTMIGALRVSLGLDSSQFQEGLKQSNSSLAAWGKRATVAAAGIAAAGAAAFSGFNRAANTMGELHKQAGLAGLSAEQFWAASRAVEQYGVNQEKLSDILKDVNDKFGDFAATGGGELKDFFDNIAPKVGLTIDSFRNLSSSDALALYVTALEQANVSQQEMTFYMEALANDATALVPAFRNGGAAIADMAKRAKELGVSFDADLAAKAREAQGDINLITSAISLNLNQALLEMGPALSKVAAAMVPVARAVTTLAEATLYWTDVAGKFVRNGIIYMIDNIGRLPSSASTAVAALTLALTDGLGGIAREAVSWAQDIVDSIIEGLRGLYEAGKQAIADLGRGFRDSIAGLAEEAAGWGRDIAAGLANGVSRGAGRVKGAVTDMAAGLKGWFTDDLEIQSPSRVFMQFGRWISEGLGIGIGQGAQGPVDAMRRMAAETRGALEDFRSDFQSSILSVVDGSKTLPQAISDMLRDISSRMLNSGLDTIFDQVFGSLVGRRDPLAGALIGAGVSGVVSTFDGGGFTGYGSRVGGIDGKGGFPAILHPNETVIDHTRGQQVGGSATFNINVSGTGNAEVMAAAHEGMTRALKQYDRTMPSRVIAIQRDHLRREG